MSEEKYQRLNVIECLRKSIKGLNVIEYQRLNVIECLRESIKWLNVNNDHRYQD